jgi:adenylate cyclase
MNQVAICSGEVAAFFPADTMKPLGSFVLPGIPNEQTTFRLIVPNAGARE